jgi:hypothetical protein
MYKLINLEVIIFLLTRLRGIDEANNEVVCFMVDKMKNREKKSGQIRILRKMNILVQYLTITNSTINNSKEKFTSHFYFLNSIKILKTLDNRSYFLLKCKNY